MNKDKQPDTKENPLDPFDTAKREGRVFGLGLKGSYRKNKITIIGFILLGCLLFFTGLLFIFQTIYFHLSREKEATNFIVSYINFLIGMGAIFLGGMMLYKVVKKEKGKSAKS